MARASRPRRSDSEPRTTDAPHREPDFTRGSQRAREEHEPFDREEDDAGIEETEHELLFDDDFSGLDDEEEEEDYD
jgi:hypothetical protein